MNVKIMSVLLFFTFSFVLLAKEPYRYNLSVCSMFKNEAQYLKEWIEFHKLVGVEHFYLYNNCSNDNYLTVLKPYIMSQEVTLIEWDYSAQSGSWLFIQIDCYSDAAKKAVGETKWLAFLDLDEFLMPVSHNDIRLLLKKYEAYGGICVNWQLYGTSFVEQVPDNKLQIEALLLKSDTNYKLNGRYKSIVRPERVQRCKSPHYFIYHEPYFHVSTTKERVRSLFIGPYTDVLRINHYWCRDEQYFREYKIAKRREWGDENELLMERYHALNQIKDDCMLRFVPLLRKAIGFVP